MHVAVVLGALRLRSGARELHHAKAFDIEPLQVLAPHAQDPGDIGGRKRVAHLREGVRTSTKDIDRQPERPGILGAHLFDDLAQLRH